MVKVNSKQLDLELLKLHSGEEFIISHNDEDFYMKISLKEDSNRLTVHTNGAIDYTVKTTPVYQRSTCASKIDAHSIYLDDRTLHKTTDPKFNTAWLIGTKERHYVNDYSEIVKIIQNILNVEDQKVFYWGSSDGGTAALKLATLHKSSTAIANNPQTNILTDTPRRRNAIFRNVFHDLSEEEAIATYYHRLTVAAFMKYHNHVPRIFYIQNNAYEPDLTKQYNPFINELKELELEIDHKLTVWLYHDTERGHGPLLPEKTLEYLHTIMDFKHL